MSIEDESKEELIVQIHKKNLRIEHLERKLVQCAEKKTPVNAEDVLRTMIDNAREAIHVL
ncbi:MAG: hypothetical protein M0P57_12120 [Syntrophales bacterium]|nr:hypothetical protein [Syntrophales bacterium]MDY0044851.1 hypothetical protein [Syntrophales bacterium]